MATDPKCVLITGCGRGLGKELLKVYARLGYQIIGVDLGYEPELARHYPQADLRRLDLSDQLQIRELVSSLIKDGPLPDLVVLSVAVHEEDNSTSIDWESFQRTIAVNMGSVFLLLALLMPALQKPCTFIFCSSGVIIFPNPSYLGYFVSKLAVTRVFDLFAFRYARRGFRFKSVILGPLKSEMLEMSAPAKGIVKVLRNLTTGNFQELAAKIVAFAESPKRRLYYRRSSAVVLWVARAVQRLLPQRFRVYQIRVG